MIAAALKERTVLDQFEPRWRRLGYKLVREPSSDQLPAFLKGFRPDAIAVGAKPSLVIAVLGARGGAAETKVRQLQALFAGHEDWRLEVIYVAPDGAPLEAVTSDEIRAALSQARAVAENEPRAGLLMAWATLEAIGRMLEPVLASRGLSPRSLVDVLISNGHLPQSEGAKLRALADTRQLLAHGQINASPKPDDVRYLVALGERLIPEGGGGG